ncbi:MAG: AAA family ATPase [Duodenibacillus sp.]|nr:AAA family ATPase [Duodenibacillus sp.]
MLKRKIEDRLLSWKNDPHRRPLVSKGLRQCGKTFSVLNFARAHYKSVVYLNFFENPRLASVFSGPLQIDHLTMMMSAVLNHPVRFIPGQTVIILDEIQQCAEARTALKFFSIDGRFDVIATGSLLGVNGCGDNAASIPVGYETAVVMRPLVSKSFSGLSEFLQTSSACSEVRCKRKLRSLSHRIRA